MTSSNLECFEEPGSSSSSSGSALSKELSYTCFPVKLFRLVTEEKYCSLWWDGCGSHFAVNVPRFEQEILRNESIPEADGFKTITFTSFIRQLNMYGFRKVAVNNKHHIDPNDLQRYAHPMFLRGRSDLLHRVKRRPVLPCSRKGRQSLVMNKIAKSPAGYKEMNQEFRCKGIRLSRKGPKRKYVLQKSSQPMTKSSYKQRRKQLRPSTTRCVEQNNSTPRILQNHSFLLYMFPVTYNIQPLINLSSNDVWGATPMELLNYSPAAVVIQQKPVWREQSSSDFVAFNSLNPQPLTEDCRVSTFFGPTQQQMLSRFPAEEQSEFKTSEVKNLQVNDSTTTTDQDLTDDRSTVESSMTKYYDSFLNKDVCMATPSSQSLLDDLDQLKLWGDDAELHISSCLLTDRTISDDVSPVVD